MTAGMATALGSGAFSSVEANRSVTVNVASDDQAYLALTPVSDGSANAGYSITNSENELELRFNGENPDTNGTGVGTDSKYYFDNVFAIRNQGTQPVDVYATYDTQNLNDLAIYESSEDTRTLLDSANGAIEVTVGEEIVCGMYIDTRNVSTNDYDEQLTIVAEASSS